MINYERFEDFYQKKFNQWQPTPIHVTLPLLFPNKNEYFLNVRNYVKNKEKDGIINDFKNDTNFNILKDIKNEVTKDLLSCVLSDIFNNDSSYSDIIDIIIDATLDALFL